MPASPLDSPMYRDLFHDAEVGKLFTDSAEVRAMMLVEGTLAKVQGAAGMIPVESAEFIHRASLELQIDPSGLSAETGQSAVVIPALVKAFRKAMEAPDHSQYVHWGATSQDIMDTGLILRLRQVIAIYETRLTTIVKSLGTLAQANADLPMAARTYGQNATVTTFGAVVASWGSPLLRHLDRLAELKPRLLQVSLSGAAGTLSVMGEEGPAIRAELAKSLNLNDPLESWHSTRDSIAEFSAWMTLVTGSLAKLGEDLLLMTHSGIGEVTLSQSGGSSTMPQKSNPVLPSLLVALARQNVALNSAIQSAVPHRQQRDGAAWFTEWMSLPQICMITARALGAAQLLSDGMTPNATKMLDGISDGLDLIYAESLSFALASIMPRPDAQTAIKELCKQAQNEQVLLVKLTAKKWPDAIVVDQFSPQAQTGQAVTEAQSFAQKTAAL